MHRSPALRTRAFPEAGTRQQLCDFDGAGVQCPKQPWIGVLSRKDDRAFALDIPGDGDAVAGGTMEEGGDGGHSTSALARRRLTSIATPPLLIAGTQLPPNTSASMTCLGAAIDAAAPLI